MTFEQRSGERERVIIVGAGQAGARAALALRQHGWQGEIIMFGDEPDPPYERPPLSKQVLTDSVDPLAATILDEAACRDAGIELRCGTSVGSIEAGQQQIRLEGGQACGYTHLVIATGSRARALPTPGAHLAGVHLLRTAAHARALAPSLTAGAEVVLVGGGFIGLEVAASAAALGCRVTVVEAADQLLTRVAGMSEANAVARLHRNQGVTLRLRTRVTGFEGVGRVKRVLLDDGSCLPADLVVVGVGSLAADGIARQAGLECANGLLVDESGRTTHPAIFAAGDVARHRTLWGCRELRLESWENAELQPDAVARAITGRKSMPRGAPWFWTDQFDMNLQLLGVPGPGRRTVCRGNAEARSWALFHLEDQVIVAASLVNSGRDRRVVRQLMDCRVVVDPQALADTDTPLATLIPAAARA